MTLPNSARRASAKAPAGSLGDFTADLRLLTLTGFALVIGAISTLAGYALAWLIGGITNLVYYHRLSAALVSPLHNQLGWWAVPIPVVGGLVVGLMARFGSEKIRGHGIPEAMESILVDQSRMEPRVAVLKPLSSAIAIGTGGPFGAEGPIIVTGGAFGSLFGQAFHLTAAERKTLLVAGAAGGMAAIFGTPVAATLIGVELLLFEWKPRSFIPVAAAAAVAGALRVPLFGAGPLFPVAPHAGLAWTALPASLGAGLAAGLAATAVTRMVYGFEDLFSRLPVHWMWWPAIGSVAVGLGGLVAPRALGVGYDTIGDLLRGHLAVAVLAALLVAKAVLWAIALSSGTSGGVLAPLLIIGGALGGLGARLLHSPDPGLWAMLTMGAMMGAAMNAPLTGMVFMLELTRDVAALPALLVACVAAHAVTVLALRRSIMTEKVARHGHHVIREYIASPLQRVTVGEVMDPHPPTLPAQSLVADIARRLAARDPALTGHHAWPLVDAGGALVGVVTRGDLFRALEAPGSGGRTVREAGTTDLVVAHPDEMLVQAVGKMAARGVARLPVVGRDDPRRLLGYLGRAELMRAWIQWVDEEGVRRPGVVRAGIRLWRMRVRRFLPGLRARRGEGRGRAA